MFELFMYVYSCNALSARFFDVDRALNSYFMIMIMIAKHLTVSKLAYVTTHFDLPLSPHFVADFLQAKCDFTRKTTVLRF